MTAQELMHRFANGLRENKRSGNVSIRDGKLYSYNLCICREFKGVYIVHSASSTVTTNKHLSWLRGALRHQKKLYVPAVHHGGEALLAVEIENSLKEASTARTRGPQILAELAEKLTYFNEFAELTGVTHRFDIPQIVGQDLKQIAQAQKALKKQQAEAQKARLERRRADLEENLARWRAGATVGGLRGIPVALRLRGAHIETSWGASIPSRFAKRLWERLNRSELTSGESVGAYHLTSVGKDRSIKVGCHNIGYSELERIAKEMGFV